MNKFLSLVLALVMVFSVASFATAETTPITLDVWYALGGSSGEAFAAIIEDFNALNTGIVINGSYSGGYNDTATKITAALSSNPKSTPDVLIGGFHFMKMDPASPALDRAAETLLSYPTVYYTGHCTGQAQFDRLKNRMGSRLHVISTGSVIIM